jgi:hypothetical protein
MGFLSFSDANYTFFSSLARDHRGSDRMATNNVAKRQQKEVKNNKQGKANT